MPLTPAGSIPRLPGLDSSLALLREGYGFIGTRCDALGSDVFETRVMLKNVVCARGAEAVRMFYVPGRFTRRGAMPVTTLKLLQDFGSVQMLDGAAHRARKSLFLALADETEAARLAAQFIQRWRAALPSWAGAGEVELLPALYRVLAEAACAWAGLPMEGAAAEKRTRELSEMIENAGGFGPRQWRAMLLRRRAERWAKGEIARLRRNEPAERSVASALAHYAENGRPLDPETAAVELLNLLRPVVAVARFVVFAALALHRSPELRPLLAQAGPEMLRAFSQEVRRTTPFFPAVGGRVLAPFEWRGRAFDKGDWVLLDLYGTNRDRAIWPEPESFEVLRFLDAGGAAEFLVPQGGGDAASGHRCPGEALTLAVMDAAARFLVSEIDYEVPEQDLSIDLARMPAKPKSGFVMREVRRRGTALSAGSG